MSHQKPFIKTLLAFSVLSFCVTIPHVIEDFHYGVPESFGIHPSIAGLLVGVGLALQVLGIIGVIQGTRWGFVITLFVATGWVLGAVLDHLPDILSREPYRQGLLSRSLEALIILDFAGIIILCTLGLKKKNRAPPLLDTSPVGRDR